MLWLKTPVYQAVTFNYALILAVCTVTKYLDMQPLISFRDVKFFDCATSVSITVITDIPCHLFCRLTEYEPQIHTTTSERRGYVFVEGLRFCFVAYEDNEQLEEADTYIHTWIKPDWPACVSKWCYFYGQVAGQWAASTSPIFLRHNVYTLPPPTNRFGEPDWINNAGWTVPNRIFVHDKGYLPATWGRGAGMAVRFELAWATSRIRLCVYRKSDYHLMGYTNEFIPVSGWNFVSFASVPDFKVEPYMFGYFGNPVHTWINYKTPGGSNLMWDIEPYPAFTDPYVPDDQTFQNFDVTIYCTYYPEYP